MPLKLVLGKHEFSLSNEALRAMATSLARTKAKERGFAFCRRGEEDIIPGHEYLGGPYSIRVRDCSRAGSQFRFIGNFHTHPRGDSRPSWGDGYALLLDSHKYQIPFLKCRGGVADQRIRCETVKEIPSEEDVEKVRSKGDMRYYHAFDDPDIAKYLTEPYSFPVSKIREMVAPPKPPRPEPRIQIEELVFANSAYQKRINPVTGEVEIVKLY